MPELTEQEKMDQTKEFAERYLPELCAEIVDWKHTGLLHGGEGGLLREMASLGPSEFYANLRIAETVVCDIALGVLAATSKKDAAAPHTALIDQENELAEWQRIKALFREEAKYRSDPRNPYGSHGHSKPGIWDSDNGPLAGHECAACAAARAALGGKGAEK